MKPLFEANRIDFTYDQERQALQQLSLQLFQHEKIVLLGSNGAGKSTFIQLLNGLLQPQSGELLYKNTKINYNKKGLRALRQKVGVVLQDPDLQLFSPVVLDELIFGPINFGMTKDEAHALAKEIMEFLRMEHLMDLPTNQLSYGQKKQVAIASIMTCLPETLVLDEPFAGLDPLHREKVMGTINLLVEEKNVTPIISTHDVDFAYEWADRIYVFKDGRCTLQGPPEAVFSYDKEIESCHLKKPVVYDIYKSLSLSSDSIPRNREELKKLLARDLSE